MPDFPKPIKDYSSDFYNTPIDELLASYKGSVELLQKECSNEIAAHKAFLASSGLGGGVGNLTETFGDDIYTLRFVLAHTKKGFLKAKEALLQTIAWRTKNAEVLFSLRSEANAGAAPPNDDTFRRHIIGGFHYTNRSGNFVSFSRNGVGCLEGLLEKMSPSDISTYMTLAKERIYFICDEESRRRNRFVLVTTALDFAGAAMSGAGKFRDAATASSREVETVFPFLMGKTVLFNMPGFIRTMMSMAMYVMPKSLAERMTICTDATKEGILAFAEKHLQLDEVSMPSFLFGKCECAGGCCIGVPNDRKTMLAVEEAAARNVASWEEHMSRASARV